MTEYASRAEVAAALRGARRIAFPPALGEPDLVGSLPDLLESPVELLVPFRTRALPLASLGPDVRVRAAFGGRGVRREDYAPIQLSRLPKLIRPGGPLEIDVALVRLAPADERGMHNVGPSASLTGAIIDAARVVVAEIDPDLPRTHGDTVVPESAVTLRVEAAAPLELPPETGCPPTTSEEQLGENVASLVPDRAPVQLGMGRATRSVPKALASHTGLRLIMGLATPDLCTVAERGALDERWHVPIGEAFGPASFLEYIDGNSRLSFQGTQQLHDVRALAALTNLVTVNSAIAVDLLGRAACETFGSDVRGGLGGLVEFLMAGRAADGGINVLALSSTAGAHSRIVRRLSSEDVSIPASLVDCVVTEWGVADLRGTTPAERAERLVAIAHPAHRDDLVNTDLEQMEEQ